MIMIIIIIMFSFMKMHKNKINRHYGQELDLFETYPCEVIRGQLYLGRRAHANMAFIQRDLKIERHVNCSGCPSILLAVKISHEMQILLISKLVFLSIKVSSDR